MLNKFFKFWNGYVIIEVIGKNSERFINICLRRGIRVWRVVPLKNGFKMCVYCDNFKNLRDIRTKTKVHIKLLKKQGIFHFLKSHRKRYAFVICMLLCVLSVYITSGHIWTVEINGVKNADIHKLVSLLEDEGVFVGAKKDGIKIGDVKRNILSRTNDITWLWVYLEGTKARVEVAEVSLPHKMTDDKTPSDMVAGYSGVIKKITVKSGDAAVKVGDAVIKGETLISGKVKAFKEGEEEKYMYVASIGDVIAYTVRFKDCSVPLFVEERVPTGKAKRYFTLEMFGKEYRLYKNKKIPYKDYDIKTTSYEMKLPIFEYIGINLTMEKNTEVEIKRKKITEETAFVMGQMQNEEAIAKELSIGSQIVDKTHSYQKNNGTITVKTTMSFTENIATKELMRSEELDKTTDRSRSIN